jgi:PDZ domain-containing secreted protein
MGELNGDARIIMDRLNQIDRDNKESHQTIFDKIDNLIKSNNDQNVKITETSKSAESTQKELTEHKSNEKWVIGIALTVSTILASVVSSLVGFFKKGP